MEINKALKELELQIKGFEPKIRLERIGKIRVLSDGVVKISGLREVASGEILSFPHSISGLVLNLEEEEVGAVILGDYFKLAAGDEVRGTGRLLSIPVGENFLGRVIDPLGRPLDNKGEIKAKKYYPLERIAPGVTLRQPVDTPLQTGIKAIDSMVPIGRGQRELIIGDRGSGKTALVLDTIINQQSEAVSQKPAAVSRQPEASSGVICIYVAIGQKTSRIAQVVATLEKYDALRYTIVVAADASSPASLQYLAPYAGCALGEYFMDEGKDAVVFYDDLTKHAWAYRELSLVLRRPSGREAYPGDIFYLHSRLLERACRLADKYGGGSLTAIPIIETQEGDISAYIPTNVISITDGQIYLESDLFYAGIRPAINVGASVSRVGGAAQIKAMKQVTGKLRLDLAQYRELSAFVQFAAELDPETKKQIDQGAKMTELLKQEQFKPMPVEEQVVLFWAGGSGLLKEVPVALMKRFEREYLEYVSNFGSQILKEIRKERVLSEKSLEKLRKLTTDFLGKWQA